MPREYAQILRQRYHIEVRQIAGDINVAPSVIGHEQGYNEVSKPEIKRRFGEGVLEAAAKESLKHWSEQTSK
jgi:predicted transcriptional regulator